MCSLVQHHIKWIAESTWSLSGATTEAVWQNAAILKWTSVELPHGMCTCSALQLCPNAQTPVANLGHCFLVNNFKREASTLYDIFAEAGNRYSSDIDESSKLLMSEFMWEPSTCTLEEYFYLNSDPGYHVCKMYQCVATCLCLVDFWHRFQWSVSSRFVFFFCFMHHHSHLDH